MSLAAIFVFLLVSALQLLDRYLDFTRKAERGSHTDEQLKLRLEIKQVLKEASHLSTPSTFAQAAKLKRLAAAKQLKRRNWRKISAELLLSCLYPLPFAREHCVDEHEIKGKQSLHDQYGRVLLITKVLIYAVPILWFWSTPVTTVPQHLVQPFGRMFSLRSADAATGCVVVGILPWLFLTSRVSKLLCQKFSPMLLHP